MRRLLGRVLKVALAGSVLAVAALVWLLHEPMRRVPRLPPADERVLLDQGWGEAFDSPARQAFHHAPLGGTLAGLRYDWLVHLEMARGRQRFADPQHLRAYGLVVDERPSPANPHQLPVGFARRYDPRLREHVLDVSCAACHTGRLVVARGGRRTELRIEGGPAPVALASARLGGFEAALTAALASTYLNPLKFSRFGQRVLGERYAEGRGKLHADLGRVVRALLRRLADGRRLTAVEEGPGRSDLVTRIGNAAFGPGLAGRNTRTISAPARTPPLWNAWKRDAFFHPGLASQPMARDLAHAFAAGATLDRLDAYGRPLPEEERFRAGVPIEGVHAMEALLQRLEPPRWPEDVLGPVDRARAERGRALFEQHCRRCHGPFEGRPPARALHSPLRTESDPLWLAPLVPLEEVGSDPAAALAAANRSVDLSPAGVTREEAQAALRQTLDRLRERIAVLEAGESAAPTAAAAARPPASTTAGEPAPLSPAALAAESALADARRRLAGLTALVDGLDVKRLPLAVALAVVSAAARERYYDERGYTRDERDCLDGFAALDLPLAPPGYLARPLAGVWATAPYLHNGSVATLDELLSPQDRRRVSVVLVPGAFDPERVGVPAQPDGDGWLLDTRVAGNWNVGHEFRAGYRPGGGAQHGVIGPELTAEERAAIVEYLKIHEDPKTPAGREPPSCGLAEPR